MSCSAPPGGFDALPARRQHGDLVGVTEPHPPVARPDRTGAQPHHVAGGAQLVEHRRPVAGDTGCQHVGLQRRGHDRRTGEHSDGLHQRFDTTPGAADPLPGGQELGEGRRIDRLDLAAKGGERAAAQLSEDLDVAPLAPDTVGTELAANDPTVELERGQCPGYSRLR